MIGQSGCPKDHLLFIWKDKISKKFHYTIIKKKKKKKKNFISKFSDKKKNIF